MLLSLKLFKVATLYIYYSFEIRSEKSNVLLIRSEKSNVLLIRSETTNVLYLWTSRTEIQRSL